MESFLRADGVKAVGFDVVFAEPSSVLDDEVFSQALNVSLPVGVLGF